MKRKVLSLLLCGLLACSTLTGCGGNDTTTGDIPVTDASGQEVEAGGTVEITEPTTEETESVTEETEVTEEVESTEEVADDFLNQNGITITPCGATTVQLALGMEESNNLTDDVMDFTVDTSIETYGWGEDGIEEVFVAKVPAYEDDRSYNILAFDRYTGRVFESASIELTGYDEGWKGVTINVNGKEYECQVKTYITGNDDGTWSIGYRVAHPSEYDGVVFEFGAATKTQTDIYNNIDFSAEFTIADYADVFIDGQTFFTISGK